METVSSIFLVLQTRVNFSSKYITVNHIWNPQDSHSLILVHHTGHLITEVECAENYKQGILGPPAPSTVTCLMLIWSRDIFRGPRTARSELMRTLPWVNNLLGRSRRIAF